MNTHTITALGLGVLAIIALGFVLHSEYAVAPAVTLEQATMQGTSSSPIATTTSATSTARPTPVTPPVSKPIGSSPAYSPFGSSFTLNIGARMVLDDGLRVTLTKIDDSRCKSGVQCIWAGELSPTLEVVVPADSFTNTTKTIILGTVRTPSVDVENYHIVLAGADTDNATFTITKTSAAPNRPSGTVSGTVTFNHICPVEQAGTPCETPREMFTDRVAIAYQTDGVTKAARVLLNPNGTYTMDVPPGSYLIQIDPAGIGAGEKKPVTVEANKTATVNFDIDTGIR